MRVSIVTAVRNSKETIRECIESVRSQTVAAEHIIIDGASTDGTVGIIDQCCSSHTSVISEPDNGIYDAMNKGISLAKGDIIGILNSDDMYFNEHVLDTVVACLSSNFDTCYGDLIYIDRCDVQKAVRYWQSKEYRNGLFQKGWMPPHPTFFVKRQVYEKYGLFDLRFPLAADYELMLRFLHVNNVSTVYIPQYLVKMRTGGSCRPGLINTFNNMKENYLAWKVNSLRPNPLTFLMKPLSKFLQYATPNKKIS